MSVSSWQSVARQSSIGAIHTGPLFRTLAVLQLGADPEFAGGRCVGRAHFLRVFTHLNGLLSDAKLSKYHFIPVVPVFCLVRHTTPHQTTPHNTHPYHTHFSGFPCFSSVKPASAKKVNARIRTHTRTRLLATDRLKASGLSK